MKLVCALIASGAMAACSPSLDWRQARPEGAGVVAMFPCRPDHHVRSVVVAGEATKMDMLVCSAAGATFALSFIDLRDPAGVTAALSELRATALANIGGVLLRSEPLHLSGMTANAQAALLAMSGHLPDGVAVQEQAAFFVKGLRIYQASVIGAKLVPEMTDTYFAGLKLPS